MFHGYLHSAGGGRTLQFMKLQDINHIGIPGTGLMGLVIAQALGGFPLQWGFAPERRRERKGGDCALIGDF